MKVEAHHEFGPSSLDLYQECPGAYFIGKLAPEPVETTDADMGTNLHAAVADRAVYDKLESVSDQELVERCWTFERDLLKTISDTEPSQGYTEERVEYRDPANGSVVFFGTCDRVVVFDELRRAVIIDWKFGTRRVKAPEHNMQMKAYALAVQQSFNVDSVDVSIYQPRIRWESKAVFTRDALRLIHGRILSIIRSARSVDCLELRPGSHCLRCRAKLICPAYQRALQAEEDSARGIDWESGISDAALAKLFRWTRGLKVFIREVEASTLARAKELDADGATVDGIGVKTRRGTRFVSDVKSVLDWVFRDWGRLGGSVSVSVSKVEKAFVDEYRTLHSGASTKEARAAFNSWAEGIVERKPDSLVLDS